LSGSLDEVEKNTLPVFNLYYPKHCPDVPDDILSPAAMWDSEGKYMRQLRKLAQAFIDNFKEFEAFSDDEIKKAGPKL